MKQIILFLAILLSVIACSTDTTEEAIVGEDLTETGVKVYEIDTFSINLSTFKFDSIITSDGARILVGQYEDPVFGKVRASSFFELISFDEPEIDDDAIFDSIGLVLHYDHYYYNDTTQISELNVHRVIETLSPRSDGYFYNTSKYDYDPTPLNSISFLPEPYDEDSLYISLPYSFGEELSDKIRSGEISSNAELTNVLKGLTLQPGINDNGSITGFSISNEETYLRFFYSLYTEEGVEEITYDLAVNTDEGDNVYFNQVTSDLSGTGLESLLSDQEYSLPSEEMSNQSFIQSGIGITTKISFPSIKNIYNINGEGTIMGCELRLYPAKNSFTDALSIEDTLGVNIIDQNNDVLSLLSNDNGIVQGFLQVEDSEFNEEYYSFQLASYIQEKLDEEYDPKQSLILIPNGYSYTVNRNIFGDQNTSEGIKAKLIVRYAVYQ